ncbi:lipopolysaccharide assembly LapA domain-containing protein [Halalkalibacter kiskunsagensis]|uniref:Lipopolysaccharide assembly LapA domain-containing protein n=1 Tax=Halalkalibacter kiskunsagensis TaxID=1548599 RepID=A0ABV6KJZ4_9BACI
MRGQWTLILGLIAAVIIAIFAVINVEAIRVNYLFGTAEWPLILVILGSVLMGAIIVGAVGMVKIYQLQAEIKRVKHANKNVIDPNKGERLEKGESSSQNNEKFQTKETND